MPDGVSKWKLMRRALLRGRGLGWEARSLAFLARARAFVGNCGLCPKRSKVIGTHRHGSAEHLAARPVPRASLVPTSPTGRDVFNVLHHVRNSGASFRPRLVQCAPGLCWGAVLEHQLRIRCHVGCSALAHPIQSPTNRASSLGRPGFNACACAERISGDCACECRSHGVSWESQAVLI